MEFKIESNYMMIFVFDSINLYTSDRVKSEILQLVERESPVNVVLNLEKVPYIDSSGIVALNHIQRKIKAIHKNLFLYKLEESIHFALKLAGLKSLLSMILSTEELENL
jgi:anti-anti-sigma factor